jgi:hypothetical protein
MLIRSSLSLTHAHNKIFHFHPPTSPTTMSAHNRKARIIFLKSQDSADVLKGHNSKKPATNASQSYLKSRRSIARAESRQNIIGFVDKNVKDLEKERRKTEKLDHSRLRNIFHKKKRRYDDKLKRKGKGKAKAKAKANSSNSSNATPPQSETRPLNDDELIVQGVLRRYPTFQCICFSDHQEMAEAELIANITNTSPTELRRLKIKLTERLKASLGITEEDSSVADSDHLIEIYDDNESDVTSLTSITSFANLSSSLSASLSGFELARKSSTTLSKPSSSSFHLTSLTSIPDDNTNIISVGGLAIMNGKYTGTICPNSGKPHGTGKLVYRGKKGIYDGEWKQGRWNGKGKHMKPNGDEYEGQFLDNLYHGEGVFKYHETKRRFEGQYVMGDRVKGTMRYADGSVYKGQFYHGRRHGRGGYMFKDGSRYKGDFVKDLMQGIGELRFRDGSKYVGEWKRGKHDGIGNMHSPSGMLCWAGTWKNGKQVRAEPSSS